MYLQSVIRVNPLLLVQPVIIFYTLVVQMIYIPLWTFDHMIQTSRMDFLVDLSESPGIFLPTQL